MNLEARRRRRAGASSSPWSGTLRRKKTVRRSGVGTMPANVPVAMRRRSRPSIETAKRPFSLACAESARLLSAATAAAGARREVHRAAVARQEEAGDRLASARELNRASLDAVDVDANLRRPRRRCRRRVALARALAHERIVRILGEPRERHGEQLARRRRRGST